MQSEVVHVQKIQVVNIKYTNLLIRNICSLQKGS